VCVPVCVYVVVYNVFAFCVYVRLYVCLLLLCLPSQDTTCSSPTAMVVMMVVVMLLVMVMVMVMGSGNNFYILSTV
jgi:hypothetical protein